MSFRTTYALFAILGLTLGVFAVALWFTPVVPRFESRAFPSIQYAGSQVGSNDIVRVEIQHTSPRETLVFVRVSGTSDFRMESPGTYRIESSMVNDVVNSVLNARAVVGVTPVTDLGSVDLDTPRDRVVLTTTEGRELTLDIGATRGDWVYLSSSDRSDVGFPAQQASLQPVFRSATEFRQTDLFQTTRTVLGFVQVREGARVAAVKKVDDAWTFVEPPDFGPASPDAAAGGDAGRSPTGVQTLLDAIGGLKATGQQTDGKRDRGFVADAPTDLAHYGLDDEKEASLIVEVRRDPAAAVGEVVLVGKKADGKGEFWYARRRDSRSVVTVPVSAVRPLREFAANPGAVRDRNLIRVPKQPDVLRLRFASGRTLDLLKQGETLAFKPDDWKLYLGDERTGNAADATVVQNVITALTQSGTIAEFVTGMSDADLGLVKPEIVVSLWIDGIKEEEKKPGAAQPSAPATAGDRLALRNETPTIELAFSKADAAKQVAVRRRMGKDLKEVSVMKVPAAVLEVIPQDELRYLSPVMPLIVAHAEAALVVSAVKVESNGKTAEIVRKQLPQFGIFWEFSAPPEVAGRKAMVKGISSLVGAVNSPPIVSWRALKPTAPELMAWGLDKPSAKFTLTLVRDGKLSDVSLLIGNKADDQGGVFVRRTDRDWVAVANRLELERLREWPVESRVFHVDPAKVKSIKLTGQAVLGIPFSIEIARKGPRQWEVANLGGRWLVNPDQAQQLMDSLREIHAVQFIGFKTGPAPAHGLDVRKGALQIEVLLDDKDRPKPTLTVGATRDGRLYAMSDLYPQDVFLIEKGQDEVLDNLRQTWAGLIAAPR